MVLLDRLAARLHIDLIESQTQLYSASAIVDALQRSPYHRGLVSVDPARPALVSGVSAESAGSVAQFLTDGYGATGTCKVLDAEIDSARPVSATFGQLREMISADVVMAIFVPAADPYLSPRSPETLARIIARLRAPGGCPWDRKQTSQSLREDIADEAFEVIDAIDNGDDANLAEELGDVLMSVTLQTQVAEDQGRFTLADVYEGINTKLVRRHPHVFGDVAVSGTDDIVANWQRIKADEKADAGKAIPDPDDPLTKYPRSMPVTMIADKLLSESGNGTDKSSIGDADRLGDQLVVALTNIRALGVDTDLVLRAALRRWLEANPTA